jgi:hypothetical protein
MERWELWVRVFNGVVIAWSAWVMLKFHAARKEYQVTRKRVRAALEEHRRGLDATPGERGESPGPGTGGKVGPDHQY